MTRFLLTPVLGLAFLLGACANPVSARPATAAPEITAAATGEADPIMGPTTRPQAFQDLARVDQQGMVSIEVIPTDLGSATDTLDFDVAMNTHSVDLSMNLATLSTLTTDTGATVPASVWEAPGGGGHHVRGTLVFPAIANGKPILEGATRLTLTIRNVDAASRSFEWLLTP